MIGLLFSFEEMYFNQFEDDWVLINKNNNNNNNSINLFYQFINGQKRNIYYLKNWPTKRNAYFSIVLILAQKRGIFKSKKEVF